MLAEPIQWVIDLYQRVARMMLWHGGHVDQRVKERFRRSVRWRIPRRIPGFPPHSIPDRSNQSDGCATRVPM
ncbi:hypothetical protein [Pseudofulvimonas gallinarii]|uniref:hypothetical protein n=1 Tax=Pseudofulvimonas gallinarii TaxID=634155 RepID=UPI00104EA405|nr:hypothetical protein [Pseudofulvimonas gallinarii]